MRKYLPSIDKRSIGLFRIGFALTLIFDLLINKWPHITRYYSEEGVLPYSLVEQMVQSDTTMWMRELTLLRFFDSPAELHFIFAFTLACYIIILIGYRSKLFLFIAFILLWSIHQRNWFIVSGPDELMINLLFISMFLPMGSRFGIENHDDDANKYLGLGGVVFLFFIGMFYFFNALLKTGPQWENGEALSYALMEKLWAKEPSSWLLFQEGLSAFLTYATKWLEYLLFIFILFPWKNYVTRSMAIFLILGLHWTIFIFLELGLFPMLVTAYCLILIPEEWWSTKPLSWITKNFRTPLIKPNRVRFRNSLVQKGGMVLLLVYISFATYKSTIAYSKDGRPDYPKVTQQFNHTTLFRQYWGMYAPNPSTTHGWYRIEGKLTESGKQIDLITGKEFIASNNFDVIPYQHYSNSVFFYLSTVYGNNSQLQNNWAKVEFNIWNELNPEQEIDTLIIHVYYQNIEEVHVESAPITGSIRFPLP